MGNGNILDLEKSLREKLRYLSIHEELTGVYNFRYFQEQLERELARCERHVTISAGVAAYPEETKDSQELFNRADQHLYQAKACGINSIKYQSENQSV